MDNKKPEDIKEIEKSVASPEILEKAANISSTMKALQRMEQSHEYSGPLPPADTWKTLNDEHKNALVNDMLENNKMQRIMNEKMLDYSYKDRVNSRKDFKFITLSLVIALVVIIGMFIFTKNTNYLSNIITAIISAGGGGAAGYGIGLNKKKDE